MSANLIVGKDPTGNKVPVAVDATGQLKIVGGGGGGGSTDMTVANAQLIAINANTDGLEGKADTGNALLTTQAADTALIKDKAISIDAKLPALSSGRIPVVADNGANQTYTYSTNSTVTGGTVVIGPLNCSQHRSLSLQITSSATGNYIVQVSNDNVTWSSISGTAISNNGAQMIQPIIFGSTTGYGAGSLAFYALQGVNFVRVAVNITLSGSTNAISVTLSPQQLMPLMSVVTNSANPINVFANPQPSVLQGFQTFHSLVCAATTNATLVKSGQGQLGTLILTNNSASWAYFKLCNLNAAPTPGTTTPVLNIGVAPGSTLDCSTAYAGLRLTSGVSYYVSAGTSLTDNTALPAAGTFLVNMTYV